MKFSINDPARLRNAVSPMRDYDIALRLSGNDMTIEVSISGGLIRITRFFRVRGGKDGCILMDGKLLYTLFDSAVAQGGLDFRLKNRMFQVLRNRQIVCDAAVTDDNYSLKETSKDVGHDLIVVDGLMNMFMDISKLYGMMQTNVVCKNAEFSLTGGVLGLYLTDGSVLAYRERLLDTGGSSFCVNIPSRYLGLLSANMSSISVVLDCTDSIIFRGDSCKIEVKNIQQEYPHDLKFSLSKLLNYHIDRTKKTILLSYSSIRPFLDVFDSSCKVRISAGQDTADFSFLRDDNILANARCLLEKPLSDGENFDMIIPYAPFFTAIQSIGETNNFICIRACEDDSFTTKPSIIWLQDNQKSGGIIIAASKDRKGTNLA